jgi:hypothetical protein
VVWYRIKAPHEAFPIDKCPCNVGIVNITRSKAKAKASLPRNLLHDFPHKGGFLGKVTLGSGDARLEFAKVGFLIHHHLKSISHSRRTKCEYWNGRVTYMSSVQTDRDTGTFLCRHSDG